MGFGNSCTQNDDECYDRNHPAIDSDGYVEDWWKRAVDDNDPHE